VCRAYEICRELDAGFPEWILRYFDRYVALIHARFDEEDETGLSTAVAEVLGIQRSGQGARTTAFSEHFRHNRNLGLAFAVHRDRQRHPDHSQEALIAAVAAEHEVSVDTVSRAWRAWRGFVEQTWGSWGQTPPSGADGGEKA
jgi:hypothetical protein